MTTQEEQQIKQQLSDPKTQRKAFERIVREYSEPLYWHVRRIVLTHDNANDVMQNVFLKAWTHLDDFHGESKISSWLYRIATNESIDFIRRNKNKITNGSDDVQSGIANMLIADTYFDGNETEALLQEAISRLPDVQRTVFNMRYYVDMKYSEISKILKTSEGALKASYHIAVKKISEYLKLFD